MRSKTNQQVKPMRSPLEFFFSLGDKVTGGDQRKKMDFDYYMMWIIFLAFGFVSIGNLFNFFISGYQINYLGWSLFGIAIMWFQYYNLKTFYIMRNSMKEQSNIIVTEEDNNKIEDVHEMLKWFK